MGKTWPKSAEATGLLARSRKALLEQCIRLIIFSTILALVSTLVIRDDVSLFAYVLSFGPFLGSYAFALLLVSRGLIGVGAWFFMAGTFIGQLGVVLVADGYQGQALVSFVNLVLIAGFTMGSLSAAMVRISSKRAAMMV